MRKTGLKAQMGQALVDGNTEVYETLVVEAETKWPGVDVHAVAQRAAKELRPTAKLKAPKNKGKRTPPNPFPNAPAGSITDRTAIEQLQAAGKGESIEVIADGAVTEVICGTPYQNRRGTQRRAVYLVSAKGYGSVRLVQDTLAWPDSTTVRINDTKIELQF